MIQNRILDEFWNFRFWTNLKIDFGRISYFKFQISDEFLILEFSELDFGQISDFEFQTIGFWTNALRTGFWTNL